MNYLRIVKFPESRQQLNCFNSNTKNYLYHYLQPDAQEHNIVPNAGRYFIHNFEVTCQ